MKNYENHEREECPRRRVRWYKQFEIPKIGARPDLINCEIGIPMDHLDAHKAKAKELQDTLRTWNVTRQDAALKKCLAEPRYLLGRFIPTGPKIHHECRRRRIVTRPDNESCP